MGDEYNDDDLGDLSRLGDFDEDRSSGDEADQLHGPLETLKELMLENPASNPRNTRNFLNRWYSVLPFRKEDLISALGGSHLFFIHGESLIMHVLSKEYVSFESDFQILSVFYLVEKHLNDLRSAGGLFRVVFFDSLENFMCQFGPQAWLLRQALITQLRNIDMDVEVFPCFASDAFRSHIISWQPSFVLVSDEPCEVFGEGASVVPLTILYSTLCLGIPAGLFYNLEQIGQKILAYAITAEYAVPSMRVHIENVCTDYLKSIPVIAPLANVENLPLSCKNSSELFKGLSAEKGGVRLALHGAAFQAVLHFALSGFETMSKLEDKHTKLLEQFAAVSKAILIHSALLDTIKLPKRIFTAIPLPELPSGEERVMPVILQWSAALAAVVSANGPALNKNLASTGDLADIIDGRLVSAILTRALQVEKLGNAPVEASFFGLSENLEAQLNSVWKSIINTCAPVVTRSVLGDSGIFPLKTSSLGFESLPSEMPEAPSKRNGPASVNVKSFLASSCPGIEDIPKVEESDSWRPVDMDALFEKNNLKPVILDVVKEQLEPSKKEDEAGMLHGWALRKYRMLPENKKEGFLKKIKLKRSQQQQSVLRAYSKSLTGADKLHYPIIVKDEKSGAAQAAQAAHAEKFKDEDSDSDSESNDEKVVDPKKAKKAEKESKKLEKERKKAEKEAKKSEKTKVSSKAAAIIEKNERALKEKMKQQDAENLVKFEKKIDFLARETDLNKLCVGLYDLAAGMYRAMDIFGDFDGLKSTLKLPESRCEVAIKLIKACVKCLTSLTPSTLSTISMRSGARKATCVLFRLVHDTYSAFTSVLDGDDMKTLQDALLSLGFEISVENLFNTWTKYKVQEAAKIAEEPSKQAELDPKAAAKAAKKLQQKAHPASANNAALAQKDLEKAARDAARLEAKVKDELKKFRIFSPSKAACFSIPKGTDASYQLEFMSHDLERTTGSEADSRVRFRPDRWQRRLLDIVDGKFNKDQHSESALVVAPTGSGKTFICYYAMEKILRRDNESRVIYVAPSKALVLQVSAEIYARFSNKQYSPLAKVVLQGEMLKEYQNRALDCQILITVPECLEMLLFNPIDQEKQLWMRNLKYVIFDEVHCIGNLGSGSIWERLFQLIPCPFLALSATVGNPNAFHAWLQRINKKQSKVHLVSYDERYSDLNKYVYKDQKLQALHTVTCFNFRQLKEHGFPHDLYLTPPETISLIRALQAIDIEDKTKRFASLDLFSPDVFFQGCRAITKKQYRMYLSTLKLELLHLIQQDETLDEAVFLRIVEALNTARAVDKKTIFADAAEFRNLPSLRLKDVQAEIEAENEANQEGIEAVVSAPEEEPEEKHEIDIGGLRTEKTYLNPGVMIGLVRHLMSHDMLPAIVFNFSRDELHRMVFSMLKKFATDQHYKYYGTEEARAKTKALNKKRTDEYERKLKEREMNENMKQMSRRQAEEQGLQYDETQNEDIGPPPGDIAEEFDGEFSFANNRVYRANITDIEDQFNIIRRAILKLTSKKQIERNERLLDALQRGIGVHHEGTNKKYRQVVEVLFRMGYLRVVLATGTLALGVNMPCKTTVFAGDSLDLTPLMFRQMSGRAGRRGFDPLGHVIFLDFPQATLQRLMTSRLGSLTGSYPLTPSLVLRGLQLEAFCEDSEKEKTRVKRAIQRLFFEPLCAVPDEDAAAAMNKSKKTAVALTKNVKLATESSFLAEEKAARERVQAQVMAHLKFTLDGLYREGLISSSGELTGFASLTTFLYKDAPANIAIQRLLTSGLLKSRLEAITTTSKDPHEIRRKEILQERDLLLILAHILQRRYLTRQVLFSNTTKSTAQVNSCFSNISPVLPPLPEEVAEILRDIDVTQQQSVSNAIFGHCKAVKLSSSEEMILPLSHTIPVSAPLASSVASDSPFFQSLKYFPAPKARSPLSAINGKGDNFESPAEIVDCARSVAIVETSMVTPAFTAPAARELRNLQNSYILDFYTHGDIDRLKSSLENRMEATDAYEAVQAFINSVRNIAIAIERMVKPPATTEESEERKEHPDQLLATLKRLVRVLDDLRLKIAA